MSGFDKMGETENAILKMLCMKNSRDRALKYRHVISKQSRTIMEERKMPRLHTLL